MNTRSVLTALALLATCSLSLDALPPSGQFSKSTIPAASASIDLTHYIDANNILMFVTNHGIFGRDLASVFGNDYGTYYPFTSIYDIINGTNITSPLYAGGLWLGGIVGGQIRVAVAEYSSEYTPGPLAGADRPEYKVYRLYADSLASNPNSDYLNWPVNQGAPTNSDGTPAMIGDQMLWTVYHDADPSNHDNDAGSTAPLGVQVQQTVWAYNQPGDDTLFVNAAIPVNGTADDISAEVVVLYPDQLNGHDYQVTVEPAPNVDINTDPDSTLVWHLDDLTLGFRLLSNQYNFSGDNNYAIVNGFQVIVRRSMVGIFESFEVVANAGGPINPPTPGAFAFRGFPTPNGSDPDASVQQTYYMNGQGWAIHTGDDLNNPRPNYTDFLTRVLRGDPARYERVGNYDFEIRFTGSFDNPGVGGSWAWDAFLDPSLATWVPFELWRTGVGTPDDPSDDLRLIPWILSYATDSVFNLDSYGADPNCGPGGCDHSASSSDNDPYTDWFYWRLPQDTLPGEAGYNAFEQAMLTNPLSNPGNELPIMDRMVFVYWNGGSAPPFDVEMPEQGTVFRIRTAKIPTDTNLFTFTASDPTSVVTGVGGESNAVYMKYKVINKSFNTISNLFISLWLDPDIGGAGDDFVGCDTSNQIWFCYNATNNDSRYGTAVPAIGFKAISTPSPWNSVNKYINGTDPNNYIETYNYMQGLNADGSPYLYNGVPTKFVHAGDPVAGTGDLDSDPSDRRLMSSYGPFSMAPNDTIDLEFKMAIGHGSNRLESIVRMKDLLLNSQPNTSCCTGPRGNVTDDASDRIDIADLVYLVQYAFGNYPAPPCPDEADVDRNLKVDIVDIAWLVAYMFHNGPPPAPCSWL